MLDVFNIPGQQDSVKIFYAAGTTDWQTFTKPRNCKFIWIMCIGGGAAGLNGTTGGNGLGGGSGGVVRVLFPSNTLPDTLFVQPGPGGQTSGASGNRSFVVINPSGSVPVAMNTVCTSGNTAASLASAETVATVSNMGLASLGSFSAVAGLANNGTYLTNTITCGGGNGGSVGLPGTGFASINLGPNIVTPNIAAGDNTTGGNGGSGAWSWKPIMYGLGGAGGGYNSSGVGGNGGNGAYGCGGGGGGQGTTAGGSFGKGGDGLVIIATF
jgi:hypothetical protein